jgi:hypothetical protein
MVACSNWISLSASSNIALLLDAEDAMTMKIKKIIKTTVEKNYGT